MRNHQSYQDRVKALVERDELATTNMQALSTLTDRRLRNAETDESYEAAFVTFRNVHDWLVKAALRRNRKAYAQAHAPLNNALGVALALKPRGFRRA